MRICEEAMRRTFRTPLILALLLQVSAAFSATSNKSASARMLQVLHSQNSDLDSMDKFPANIGEDDIGEDDANANESPPLSILPLSIIQRMIDEIPFIHLFSGPDGRKKLPPVQGDDINLLLYDVFLIVNLSASISFWVTHRLDANENRLIVSVNQRTILYPFRI